MAVTALLLVVDIPLELEMGTFSSGWALVLVLVGPFSLVGMVVARREPRNPLGWLLIVIGFWPALTSIASDYALFVYRFGHHNWPFGPLAVMLDFTAAGVVLAPIVIILFPDGQLGGRWRWALRGFIVIYALYIVGSLCVGIAALGLHTPVDSSGNVVDIPHPGDFTAWVPAIKPALVLGLCAICIASVVRQVLSYRSSTGVRRQQLKWLAAGGVTCVVNLSLIVSGVADSAPGLVWVFILVGFAALPASIGVAILKYRLYEIDRLISRTLSYAILTAMLVGTFIGLVALSTEVLPFSSPVGVAASTLAAAALFNPLRKRVQRIVDRRFNRSRYDAEQTVTEFAARLRDAVEIDTIRGDLLEAVNLAVQPSHASVWIRPRV